MASVREKKRWWRYFRGLIGPIVLWVLFVALLITTVRSRLHGDEEYDQAALREWVEESRSFRETLPEMVRHYLVLSEQTRGQRDLLSSLEIREHLQALCDPTKMYQGQLPLFPTIYRLELEFKAKGTPNLSSIVWESGIPRPQHTNQIRQLNYPILGPQDDRAFLHFEYQLHAYNKRQRDEEAANTRLRWIGGLTAAATTLAFLWIYHMQGQKSARERQQSLAEHQVNLAERLLLEGELNRQEADRRSEEIERKLLEQRLATQAAERKTLELKSQLYASIGIMAGSYAHNIKNLLVRPNDLLRRCLEANKLSSEQDFMLREVRQTLGTVTERLQQILQTVRRDPSSSIMEMLDLNSVVADLFRNWGELARDKWKLSLTLDLCPEPIWIEGDRSHLQQAVENLLFNARDATFEMRVHLRDQARLQIRVKEENFKNITIKDESDAFSDLLKLTPSSGDSRKALIAAAGWKGTTTLRTRRLENRGILEVQDNGIGMTEEVRQHCMETHFSTKRDNALHESNSTGMGLGLSFVEVILEHHQATMEIASVPLQGALFRISFPLIANQTTGGETAIRP